GVIALAMFLAFGSYHVFGTGYASMTLFLNWPASLYGALLPALVVLAIAKPVASAITIGSGGAGGMFSVSLYQGVLWGGLVGIGAHAFFPGLVSNPAAYALVGMAAFYAASTRATLTSIVML